MTSEDKSLHPLRPYHDPLTFHSGYPAVYRPGIGVVIDDQGNTITSKLRFSTTNSSYNSSPFNRFNGNQSRISGRALSDISKIRDLQDFERNVYSDLEIAEYLDWTNIGDLVKSLVRSFVQNYVRGVVTQPFEVVRLLLQVGVFQKTGNKRTQDDFEQFESDEEVDYFQPKELVHTRTDTIRRKPSTQKTKTIAAKHIEPVSLNTVDVMSALLSLEGTRGLWRANNASFIVNALSVTIEAWITGFISPFLHIPDPFFVDSVHSPDPVKTLVVSISAAVLTGLLLAPLDLIRTKLIVTSVKGNERSIRNSIKNLKFFTCPVSLIIPTVMNSLTTQLFKKFTPYFLYFKLGVDIYSSPLLYNTIKLTSSLLELFVKLPIETMLRRSQLQYLLKPSMDYNPIKINKDQLIIKPVEGWGAMKGELWRGWRVGVLNVVGVWGVNVLQWSNDAALNTSEKL